MYIERVDFARGIAILLVFFFHVFNYVFPSFEATTYSENGMLEIESWKSFVLNFNPIGQGWIGVELFLIISGFLIHYIYLKNGSNFKGKLFFSKRFWRIYPPYLIILGFFFIHQIDLSTQGLINFFTHVFLIHNLNDTTFFSINPSFWSIALEAQLYLLYPLFLFLVNKLKMNTTILVIGIMNITITLIAIYYKIESIAYATFVLKFWLIWCLGAYLAYKYFKNEKVFKNPFLWFLFFYFLFFIFKWFYITNFFILIPISFAFIALLEFVIYSDVIEKYVIGKLLIKWIKFIGVISYSIYLVHQPFLKELLVYLTPESRYQLFNTFVSISSAFVIVLLISYSLYIILEQKSVSIGQFIRKKNVNPQSPI